MAGNLKVFIVAGEASGDRLGGALMAGLKQIHDGEIDFFGIGGPLMIAQGLVSQFPMQELSLFGLLELLPKWRHLKLRLNQTIESVINVQPDVLVTIDSPGFCLRLTAALKGRTSAPIVHYVAPSVWAWRPKRAEQMARHIDHILALLPFDPPFMEAAGMSCDFVGHPVTSEPMPSKSDVKEFRQTFDLLPQDRLITILPGSRVSEIKRLSPIFFATAKALQKQVPNTKFVIPVAASHLLEPIERQLEKAGLKAIFLSFEDMSADRAAQLKRTCFAASELALAASGTVSIELAAAGVPMVIGYKVNGITGWIMRRAMLAPSFTLVNLLTNSNAVPEFFASACTIENLHREMLELLTDPTARDAQIAIGKQAIDALSQGDQNPGLGAAKSVLAQLTKNK